MGQSFHRAQLPQEALLSFAWALELSTPFLGRVRPACVQGGKWVSLHPLHGARLSPQGLPTGVRGGGLCQGGPGAPPSARTVGCQRLDACLALAGFGRSPGRGFRSCLPAGHPSPCVQPGGSEVVHACFRAHLHSCGGSGRSPRLEGDPCHPPGFQEWSQHTSWRI